MHLRAHAEHDALHARLLGCSDTASSASSSGRPALTSVASWRVSSARSRAEMPRRSENAALALCLARLTSATLTGSSGCSRRSWRTCRGVAFEDAAVLAAAGIQRRVLNAPMRHQSSRVTRSTSSSVVSPAGSCACRPRGCSGVERARVALELVLAGAVVDHRAHRVVDLRRARRCPCGPDNPAPCAPGR